MRFVSRYLAFLPNNKVIREAERDALWAAGIGILLNWEQSEGDFLLPALGASHGAEAARQAADLGYPRSLPILVSCDRDAPPHTWQHAADYFANFRAAAGGYPVGAYAQAGLANLLLSENLVSMVWAPAAASWNHGIGFDRLDFTQFVNAESRWPQLRDFGQSIDVNVVERPIPVWLPGAEPPRDDHGFQPVVHERGEWLTGYELAAGEGSAWWGAVAFPPVTKIDNITWHYPAGSSNADPAAELRRMQADYHRRTDSGSDNGRPAPFNRGYNLGYNVVIDLGGEVWKVRWTDQRCAANALPGNLSSFAVQFMTAHLDDDLTAAQVRSARWLDGRLRERFPNIPDGVAGHRGHRDWFSTACPGDLIYNTHVIVGGLLRSAGVDEQTLHTGDDEDMRFKFYKAKGFHDLLAVGPGNPFNPGSPEAAQELVDHGQLADEAGNPVPAGTDYRAVPIEVSVNLWTAMNSGSGPTAPEA